MLIDYINRTNIENQINDAIQEAISEVAENIEIRDYIYHETIIEKVTDALEDEISELIKDMTDDIIEKL